MFRLVYISLSIFILIQITSCGSSCSPSDTLRPDIPPPGTVSCDTIYQRGEELGRGGSGVLYNIGTKNLNNSCFDLHNCSNAVVKEKPNWDPSIEAQVLLKTTSLQVAPPIYGFGQCLQKNTVIGYIIQKKLFPATIAIITPIFTNFKKQIEELLRILHDNDLTQGDIHLGNILYEGDPANPQFYFTDFDKGIDLSKVSAQEKSALIDSENLQASQFFQGNYYPPMGWPPLDPDDIDNTYRDWHTLAYKWKAFDQNKNGLIDDGEELNTVAAYTKNLEKARISQRLYSLWLSTLTKNVKLGLINDTNGDGINTFHELGSLTLDFTKKQEIMNDYLKYTQGTNGLITLTTVSNSTNDDVVTNNGFYASNPLKANQILIISSGDYIKNQRKFPLITRQSLKEFARYRGFSFNHFLANAASPRVGYWSKIFMILNRMEDPENRVIVWFDDDGIVDQKQDMIEQYINAYPNAHTIIATDPEAWATLNTGALIVANTKENYRLFNKILDIGSETRYNPSGILTSEFLMFCSQEYWCLHEQQSMQELYLNIRRELTSLGTGVSFWPPTTDYPRYEKENWEKFIQVVPQIDLTSQRNLNLFAKWSGTSFGAFKGRADVTSDQKIPYAFTKKPFYLQCSGQQDKNICVEKLKEYYQ